MDLDISSESIKKLDDDKFRSLAAKLVTLQQMDLRENQLLYYKPVNEKVHQFTARKVAIFGGNGSSKTEGGLTELLILATGIIPFSLEGVYPKSKLRGPVNCRVICESLTTVLYPVILPKLQWWKWTGVDKPGGKGHWGWIPKTRLIDGSWEKSWSDKVRMLRLKYIDPDDPSLVGESMIQFMSVDQDPTDMASGDFHFVLCDEPPSLAIWRENEARTMRVNGRMMLTMTWPDDPSIGVDWIFDEIYDRTNDPNVECLSLYTTDNPYLDQDAVKAQADAWSDEVKRVRIYGEPIRFSNRIHPLFTDITHVWCYKCHKTIIPDGKYCGVCGSEEISSFNHVTDESHRQAQVIFALDPHPRKPHMFCWVAVDPYDDLLVIAEGEVDGDPVEVKLFVDNVEKELKLNVVHRTMDPNMGASPSGARRGVVWRDEFDSAGLFCDLADDSDVGRGRINEYLKPDKLRLTPRLKIHARCQQTIHQMKRYVWDDFRRKQEKDLKQIPKPKYDDYPTLLKYVLNMDPTFRAFTQTKIISRFRKNSRDHHGHHLHL